MLLVHNVPHETPDDIVMRVKSMASLRKASLRDYTSVCNHIYNKAPFADREKKIFMNDSDFVALVEQEETKSFDGFVEDVLSMLPCRRLTRVRSTPLLPILIVYTDI